MSFKFEIVSHTTIFELFKNQQLTNVTFLCSDGEIGAHLSVLKANSKWFHNKENLSLIALPEHTREAVFDFLTLFYIGSGEFKDHGSLTSLLNLFQCEYLTEKLNNIIEEKDDKPESDLGSPPAAGSGTITVRKIDDTSKQTKSAEPPQLLPNPFALVSPVVHKRSLSTKEDGKNVETTSSPLLVTNEEKHHNNICQVEPTNNGYSSDSSDVCIIEPPCTLIEINDTVTQESQLFQPIKVEDLDNIDANLSGKKRKAEHNIQVVQPPDAITSDETEIEVSPTRSPPKKKKFNKRMGKNIKNPLTDGDSDDSVSSLQIRSRRLGNNKKRESTHRKNRIRYDSADDEIEEQLQQSSPTEDVSKFDEESSGSKKPDLETKVMKFKTVGDMKQKFTNFCLTCQDYYPCIKAHVNKHQVSKTQSCPDCSKKFNLPLCLNMHRKLCNKN